MKICYKVPKCYEDQEIYKILVREFRMSGVMIKRLKFHGTVNLNGIHATVREHVHEGDELYLEYGDSEFSLNRIDSIPILYEDSHYAVINKPAGIVTHPVHGHLVEQVRDRRPHRTYECDRRAHGIHTQTHGEREAHGALQPLRHGVPGP
jgi:23S rRNA pseudouridine1911/1915/1917 synthase